MRGFQILFLWLLAMGVASAQVVHPRGDFAFSTGPVPAFVQRQAVAETWDPAAPGAQNARWRFWRFDRQVDRRGGADREFVDYAYEAKSASLLGEAGRFQIDFNPEYQRLTIHEVALRRDGRWTDRLAADRISLARRESGFENDMADGEVTALIVLDDVRVDDVVRIAYSVDGSNPILAGQVYDRVRLAWSNPMLDVSMRVLHAPGTQPLVITERTGVVPVVRALDDAVEVSASARGAAAVVDEGDYPAWYRPHPTVTVSAPRTWADVVAWALPLYPRDTALPPDLEQRIAAWRALRDPALRLRAALRAVQDEVRYFGVEMGDNTHRPAAPGETWARRYGDCKDKSYLLSVLLARLDIPAVPALVSNSFGKAIGDGPPSASAFDHVVVRVQLGRDVVWVDPTATLEGGDPRDSDLRQYGLALPVSAGTTALEAIGAPRTSARGVHSLEQFTADAEGKSVQLDIRTTYRGRAADGARRAMASERSEERARRYAEYYRKRFGDLTVVDAPTLLDDREDNVLVVTEGYVLLSALKDEGAAVKALGVYAEAMDGPSALPPTVTRDGPLQPYARGEYVHESRMAIPARWKPRFSRERSAATSAGMDYARTLSITDGTASIVHRMAITRDALDPADVPAHIAELRRVREELSSRLRFEVPGDVAGQSRQARLEALLQGVLDDGAKP